MRSRLQVILVVIACLVAACSGSDDGATPTSTIAGGVSTTTTPSTATTPTTTGTPTATLAPSTTTARSLGGYNVTPLRSDGQRVTFRLTTPDGATGEVSFAPADTIISSIEPSIVLTRPNGQPAGGGGISSSAKDDAFFASYCGVALGGNCSPMTTEPIVDGNVFETFARSDGRSVSRVVFGPWAMFVQDRDIANAFSFRSGPDGFPLVVPLAAGWTTSDPFLRVYIGGGPPYYLRSNSSGMCTGDTATSGLCDRGLSIDRGVVSPAPSIRRIN